MMYHNIPKITFTESAEQVEHKPWDKPLRLCSLRISSMLSRSSASSAKKLRKLSSRIFLMFSLELSKLRKLFEVKAFAPVLAIRHRVSADADDEDSLLF